MKCLFCVYYLQEIHKIAVFDGHLIILSNICTLWDDSDIRTKVYMALIIVMREL